MSKHTGSFPCGSSVVLDEIADPSVPDKFRPAVATWLRFEKCKYGEVHADQLVSFALHDPAGSPLSGKGYNAVTLQVVSPAFAEQIGWALIAAAHNKRAAQVEEGNLIR